MSNVYIMMAVLFMRRPFDNNYVAHFYLIMLSVPNVASLLHCSLPAAFRVQVEEFEDKYNH